MAEASKVEEFLFEALKICDHETVEKILEEHPDVVNVRREQESGVRDTTPLLEACFTGSQDIVKVLIKHGADVCCTGCIMPYYEEAPLGHRVVALLDRRMGSYGACDDVFPLYVACSTVNIPVVQELIKAGADLNQVTAVGQSALHSASKNRDGSHLARFASLGYKPKRKLDATELMRILIEGGTDVNLQDATGQTALHLACWCGNLYLIKLLLEKGADHRIRDKFGMSVLEIAAHKSYELMEDLLQLCPWTDEEKIEAYEIGALAGNHNSSPSILKGMSQATYMRTELNCPKNVLHPMEHFANMKEWETLCEIERLKEDFHSLKVQCLIARERIYRGRCIPIDDEKITEVVIGMQDTVQQQAMFRHYLDVCRKNDDYLYFVDMFVKRNGLLKMLLTALRPDVLETASIVDIINLSSESAERLRSALEKETKCGAQKELVCQFEQTLLTTGAFILLLIRRAREYDEHRSDLDLAKSLLRGLVEAFPHVSHEPIGYYNPLLNILLNKKYTCFTAASYPILANLEMVEMILQFECVNVNKKDSEGNTALHVAITPFPVRFTSLIPDESNFLKCNNMTENLIKVLLDKGAYVYARNKLKQTIFDILNDPKNSSYDGAIFIQKLLIEHDGLPSLKRLTAQYLCDSKVNVESQLPSALREFVNLH